MKFLFYSKQTLAVVLFCLGFMSNTIFAQTPNLLIKATSATSADYSQARSMAVDASGNTYITGYFSGSVAFGSTTLVSAGGTDIFLAKYDNTGSFQWAKRAGGTSGDQAYGVAVSGSDVYITGVFRGTANFNTPSATGSNELTTVGTNGDVFLARYAGAVLPIELLSFSGKNTEGGNLLTWQTASEVNNKGFQVERLMDNGQWTMDNIRFCKRQ